MEDQKNFNNILIIINNNDIYIFISRYYNFLLIYVIKRTNKQTNKQNKTQNKIKKNLLCNNYIYYLIIFDIFL